MVGHSGGHHMRGMKGGHMRGGVHMPGGGHMKGMKGHMKNWQRFGRGHIVPPHFRSPRFFVHDWRSFGWPAPMPGGNWIRYHDDALLVDGHGRVMDSRYGWDWDRRGGHMAYDDYGYGEDYGYEEDYAESGEWDEEGYGRGHHGGGDRVVRVYRHGEQGDCRGGGCGPGYMPPPPPPHPGYGYGHGGGYGYAYGAGCACGPVVVTETITTTAPVMETHTYYETVTEHRAAPRRHYKKPARHYSKPVVRRSVKPAYRAPAPQPGERG
jgi:Ni/Co efflux regulator RcnB